MFTIWNFSSQTCEQFFRATRSLTTTFSTVVNFSMKGIISRLKRIETINTIKTELKNASSGITFDREKNTKSIPPYTNFTIYSENNILSIINRSCNDAKYMAKNLGMSIDDIIMMQRPLITKKFEDETRADIETSDEESSYTNVELCSVQVSVDHSSEELEFDAAEDLDNLLILENCGMGLNLKDFRKQSMNDDDLSISKIPISSSFVNVILANKTSMIIKKSSLCWLLEQPRDRVSSDRLRRFINTSNSRPHQPMSFKEKARIIKKKSYM